MKNKICKNRNLKYMGRMKKVLMLGAVAVVTTVTLAQSTLAGGYIINANGDTLKGQVKYNAKNDLSLFDAVSFQTNATDKKSYRPNKIKEFAFDENVFVSRMIDDKAVFVKRLSNGAVNLYQYKTEQYFMNAIHTYIDYYMEKSGSTELIHIKESKFKKQLSEVMGDNEELIKDIHEKKYDYDKIVDIFEQYNNKPKEGNKG
jgi:hypothetical protein